MSPTVALCVACSSSCLLKERSILSVVKPALLGAAMKSLDDGIKILLRAFQVRFEIFIGCKWLSLSANVVTNLSLETVRLNFDLEYASHMNVT